MPVAVERLRSRRRSVAQRCAVVLAGRRPSPEGRGIWPLEMSRKSAETGQNPPKKVALRNMTGERTPALPCCTDIKTAKSGPTERRPCAARLHAAPADH